MVTGLWYTQDLNFGSLSRFWRCKEDGCPLSPNLGFWRMLEVPDWGFTSWCWYGWGHWPLIHQWSKFGFWSRVWLCKENWCPGFGSWRALEVPDWGFAFEYLFEYWQWSLVHSWSQFWLSIFILKVQRTPMSFKSWFGSMEDTGGSWLRFCILILIWMWSLVFGRPLFQIFVLYLYYEGAKSIHVL